jgi:hypothetical protein
MGKILAFCFVCCLDLCKNCHLQLCYSSILCMLRHNCLPRISLLISWTHPNVRCLYSRCYTKRIDHRVSLLVVRGDQGNSVPECLTGPPCPWGYKYGNLSLNRDRKVWVSVLRCPEWGVTALKITDPSSRQRGPPIVKKRTNVLREFPRERKIGRCSQMVAWYQDRLAEDRRSYDNLDLDAGCEVIEVSSF